MHDNQELEEVHESWSTDGGLTQAHGRIIFSKRPQMIGNMRILNFEFAVMQQTICHAKIQFYIL